MRDKYLARWAVDKEPTIRRRPRRSTGTSPASTPPCATAEEGARAAEPKHLAALVDFAERAYRRPLTAAERADMLAYYRTLRSQEPAVP